MYMKNLLVEPGALTLAGTKIDLSKVTTPAYFVSAIEDHIAPWKTTYAGTQILRGKSRFVLSGSGHIAGMVNPPAANKYGFWTNDKVPATPDAWFAGAKQHEGSWWTNWRQWVAPYLGREVPARVPGKGKLKVIEAAPGTYARIRADGK
jgi:polyhydroxyalkanoate synthase